MHYLDYKKDAEQPRGTVPVESERDFLRLALSPDSLFVRGNKLCEWASLFWGERGMQFTRCASLSEEITTICGSLSPDQISKLLQRQGPIILQTLRPYTLVSVLDAIFPEDHWHQQTSLQHAARWLLWLSKTKPDDYLRPLLAAQSQVWTQSANDFLKPLYQISSASDADILLRRWLRIESPYTSDPEKPFPLAVPSDLRTEAGHQWRTRIIQTMGSFFGELIKERIPSDLVLLAATLTFEFFEHHPELLTEIHFRQLRPYLPDEKTAKLRGLLRPQTPASIPATPSDAFRWFSDSYLPYREWCIIVNSNEDIERSNNIAKEFSLQFLHWYPQLIMSESASISFQKAGQLRGRRSDEVTIYVILDGLNVPDSIIFLKHIMVKSSRLTVLDNTLCFAPVPTITPICKPALKRGYTPRIAATDGSPEPPHVKVLPEKKDPTEFLKQAHAGDLFIWSILEPDETYHSKGYDLQTLKKTIANILASIAERVVNASLAVPDDKKTRIIITTDHGRLLCSSKRNANLPPGMESHQRAAIGQATVEYAPNGLFIDKECVAFLNNETFHTVTDTAVVIGDNCFVMDDGKSGVELFPHGGVFPEEVIIPWIEIGRDIEMPKVVCKIAGSGQEATEGTITIAIENPGSLNLHLAQLDLDFGSGCQFQISVDRILTPWARLSHECKIKPWPSESQIRKASAKLTFIKPDGDEFSIQPELFLQVKGFQTRSDILDDLL